MLQQEHSAIEAKVSDLSQETDKKLTNAIRLSAMNLLSRREHSQYELLTKLDKRYPEETELIQAVLQKLIQQGLQSDQRFCEAYTRSSIAKYHGPNRLRQNLKVKGLGEELIEGVLQSAEIDWFELAKALRIKKYGNELTCDIKEKAKQQRFMQYRGFSFEQILYAMKNDT